MSNQFYSFIFILSFAFGSNLQAQTNDNILWASFKVQQNITPKTSLTIRPIIRFNENLTNYQNMSIDISAKRKFGKGWSMQLLSRTWFIPEQKNREFLWVDLAYEKPFKNISAGTSLRYHYALDINDRKDPDYIRWKTTVTFLKWGKVKPFLSIEPWFRLNGIETFQRIRYEPGLNYKFTKQLSLNMTYRREESLHLSPKKNLNMYLVTLSYTIPK